MPNLLVGIGGVVVSSLVWGSCFVVIKGYDDDMPPNGIHFAFLMSIGILVVGILTLAAAPMDEGDWQVVVSPLGLCGGSLWALGNFLTTPIIQKIGLGVGLAIWAGVNMIVAFGVGAVGLEWIGIPLPPEQLKHPRVGGLGVVLAMCALVVFAHVQPNVENPTATTTSNSNSTEQEQERLLASTDSHNLEEQDNDSSPLETTPTPTTTNDQHPTASLPLLEHFEVSSSPVYDTHNHNHHHHHLKKPGAIVEELRNRHRQQQLQQQQLQEHTFSTLDPEEAVNNMNNNNNNSRPSSSSSSTSQNSSASNVPLGVLMGVVAGLLYGVNFVPLAIWNNKVIANNHIFNHPLPSSDSVRALRFFFSQFTGIFLTALMGFVVYAATTTTSSHHGELQLQLVPPQATLPSIVCGAVWAVGCAGAMLATSELGNAVGFPLLLNCSFLINSAWSIVVFHEIQGRRNLQLFGGAFLLNVMSSLFISISKG